MADDDVLITDANNVERKVAGIYNGDLFSQRTIPSGEDGSTIFPDAAALADAQANPNAPTLGAALEAYNGSTWNRLRTPNIYKDLDSVAIGSIATVWTPGSGKKFRLMGGSISVSSACSVLFEDNAGGTTIIRTPKLMADIPYTFDLGNGVLSGAANRVLKATASVSPAVITGHLYGIEE
jgi:hypothetical protein